MARSFVRSHPALFRGAVAALVLFMPVLLPAPAAAQQSLTTGSINGRVTDNTGEPLANATVTVRNAETGVSRDVQTDSEGRFSAGLLRPGPYVVRADFPPLEAVERGPFQVTVGEERVVTLALQPVAVEAIAVTIVDEAAAIDLTQAGVVETITEEQIDNLPTAGRDFTDFIALSGLISPQQNISTGGQFSVGGARTSGTNVTVDGADANNAFFGENQGSSRIPFAFSLESIKEFQVITNGYDVEYGKFSGGLINAVTKGGTNEFEGSAFFYGRDEALTAENFDGSDPEEFTSYQFGGVISGPIIEDELHYFVSADFQERDQPVFTLTPEQSGIPQADIDEFLDIVQNVYGLNTTGQFGVFEETDDEVALFGRLDWSLNQNNRLTLRGNYTDFDNTNDRISRSGNEARTMGGTFIDESFSLVGELNSVLGETANVYNTLRLHYSDQDRPRPGNSTLPSATVDVENGALEYGGNFFGILFSNRLQESKFQFTDNLTWQAGDHTFKVGTDNVFSNTLNRFWLNGNGFFTFDNLEDFRNGEPGFSLRFVPAGPDGGPDPNPSPPTAEFDTREYSVYAQDEWQASDRLLLQFGLRYDYTDFATTPPELAIPEFAAAIEAVGEQTGNPGLSVTDVPSDGDNIGPRASFTYDLRGDETSVLRGGAGLFYARVPTVLHGNVLQITPNPLIAVVCIAAATPDFNYGQWEDPDNIPTSCAFEGFQGNPFGIGIIDVPETTTWNEDLEMPRTWKANLGYEQRVGEGLKAGIQGIYSRTTNNFHVQNLNLQAAPDDEFGGGVFTTAEGRPVFADPEDFDPSDPPLPADVALNEDLATLYYQTDTGVAEIWNLKLDLEGRLSESLLFGTSYTMNHAFDNTSFVCCTANAGVFDIPTGGNPNFIGDFGDEERGAWGPSDFQRRHVFILNGIWQAPGGFDIGLIYRANSGNPFTPRVNGDVNFDSGDENDRPFIVDPSNPTQILFGEVDDGEIVPGTPERELAEYQAILADGDNECLRDAIGSIISRNTCTNPWWHSVDLKLTKGFQLVSGQELELTLDLFNLLDAFGMDAGELVFKRNDLLIAEGYDPETNRVIYSVDNRYGQDLPVGFGQFQFQAQLGARYRF
ncbi:MAG TPA: TonB-dependent receptor [Gemmatimonadota bacterium]|nr:TonB-dependent receptor [Gemmatimonadota bacterium]